MRRYSVVIVARDGVRQLLGTLLALRRHARPTEVLLVDNASSGSLEKVAALSQLPLRLLRLPEHRSLGAAFNHGLDATMCEYVLLLHADVLLESDPAAGLEFLERDREVGVLGAKLFYQGEPPRRVRNAGYAVGRGRVGPSLVGRGEWDRFSEPADVAAVSHACMLLRRTDVRFDERFWFRLEDVDLCLQYGQRGYRTVFFPGTRAVHLEAGGARERAGEFNWAARQLASQLLYHQRWCSDLCLGEHPPQHPLRGEAALQHLRQIDSDQCARLTVRPTNGA